MSDDGYVQYGPQRYRSVVLYHPELDKPATAELFRKAAKGKTALYRLGDWTQDFDGKPFDGADSLPSEMVMLADEESAAKRIVQQLEESGMARQAPANRMLGFLGLRLGRTTGHGRNATSRRDPHRGFGRRKCRR